MAIKKVYQDKRYKNRELQIMKELCHPNVINLQHAFYTQGDKVRILSETLALRYSRQLETLTSDGVGLLRECSKMKST